MARERKDSILNKTRWIDAPDGGTNDTVPSREKAVDRPVLMLLKQNGTSEQGWRDTPFYWPVFVMPQNTQSGIFTINGKKKAKAAKKQIKLETIGNYPPEEILHLTIRKDALFDILAGEKEGEVREIKRTTASLYLEKDMFGNFILIEGADPNKYYDLSSVNDNKFPYEIKEYKYLHLRASQDNSGSQALVKLKEDDNHHMYCEPFKQQDVVYSDKNESNDAIDESAGIWFIDYHIDKVLESKLSKQDAEMLTAYEAELKQMKKK